MMLLKTKDIFTVCTIVLGFLVLPLAYTGELFWASMMILLGGLFDLLDGIYARLTKTGNKFGAEFDCIADLIIYSMAPGILLFFVYKDYNIYLATIVGILPLLFGCIRLARFNVKRIEYPGFWMGLPRPGSAVAIVALVNSTLFARYDLMIAGAVFVLAMSVMNVTIIPYMGHHKRKFSILLKTILILALVMAVAAFFYGHLWDVLLVYALLYILTPVYAIRRKERKKINKFIAEWKSDSE